MTCQDVGVTYKDVRVRFNCKGLPFQSVWMSFWGVGVAYQDMEVPCQGV